MGSMAAFNYLDGLRDGQLRVGRASPDGDKAVCGATDAASAEPYARTTSYAVARTSE